MRLNSRKHFKKTNLFKKIYLKSWSRVRKYSSGGLCKLYVFHSWVNKTLLWEHIDDYWLRCGCCFSVYSHWIFLFCRELLWVFVEMFGFCIRNRGVRWLFWNRMYPLGEQWRNKVGLCGLKGLPSLLNFINVIEHKNKPWIQFQNLSIITVWFAKIWCIIHFKKEISKNIFLHLSFIIKIIKNAFIVEFFIENVIKTFC